MTISTPVLSDAREKKQALDFRGDLHTFLVTSSNTCSVFWASYLSVPLVIQRAGKIEKEKQIFRREKSGNKEESLGDKQRDEKLSGFVDFSGIKTLGLTLRTLFSFHVSSTSQT